MILKTIGIIIFVIIFIVSMVLSFYGIIKQKKKCALINENLFDLLDIAEDRFVSIDTYGKKFIDNKIYIISDIKDIDYKFLSNIKSQYNTFAICFENRLNKINDIAPLFISRTEYLNIYLFMKEIEFHYNKYMESKIMTIDFSCSYNQIVAFMEYYELNLEDIYFGPVAEKDSSAALNLVLQKGFNVKKSPQQLFNCANRKKDIDLFKLDKYDKEYEIKSTNLFINLLNDATEITVDNVEDELCILIIGNKINDSFILNINILSSQILNKILSFEHSIELDNIIHNNLYDDIIENYSIISNMLIYMINNNLSMKDIHILEIDKKKIKKIMKNIHFINRILVN